MKTCLRGRGRGIPSAPQTADTTLHNTRSEIHGYNNTDKDKKKRSTGKVRVKIIEYIVSRLVERVVSTSYCTVQYL
jgi:hypothetical protein